MSKSTPTKSISRYEFVKVIFTNLLFTIGVIVLIIGFVNSVRTVTKLVVFDEYPLRSYEESRCDNTPAAPAAPLDGEQTTPQKSAQEYREECVVKLNHDRKIRQVEDITTSVSLVLAGGALVAVFRRFIWG